MSRPVLLLLFVATAVSGCLGSTAEEEAAALDGRPGADVHATPSALLVEYGTNALLAVNWPTPVQEVACGEDNPVLGPPNEKYQMKRLPGGAVGPNHTRLEFSVVVQDAFADAGLTGYRVGAFYGDELVFWTESLKESVSFEHGLDGSQYDRGEDAQWTFFFKRVDFASEDDEDACASGVSSGGFGIQVYAR